MRKGLPKGYTYVIHWLDAFRMLVRDVLLDEGSRLEQLLTLLAPELALILLLYMRLDYLR